MATDFVGAEAANPSNPTAGKCPFTGANGPRKHTVAGGPTNAGWWPDQCLDQIQNRGVCVESCFPYASAFPGGVSAPRSAS